MPLPTYPFERKRYWIEPAPVEAPLPQVIEATCILHRHETNAVKEPEMQTSSSHQPRQPPLPEKTV